MFKELKQFIYIENAQERYLAIEQYAQSPSSWQWNLLTWQILSLLPTNQEKVTLAKHLKISYQPESAWVLFTYLLKPGQNFDVKQQCILNIANKNNHVLGLKILQEIEFENKNFEHIEFVLDYMQKTGDIRFKTLLNTKEILNLPEKLFDKILNCFLKYKIISMHAIQIAFNILEKNRKTESHNSEIYTAIYYIFFAGNSDDFTKLMQFKSEIKNNNLLKICELCFQTYTPLQEIEFFENALFQTDPLFFGFGCISQDTLIYWVEDFIQKNAPIYPYEVTRTILNLKNEKCTEILAQNKIIGLSKLTENLIELWIKFAPLYNEDFVHSVKNTNHYHLWHKNKNSHLGFLILDFKTLFNKQNPSCFLWQDFFEENLDQNSEISMQIIFFQIMSLHAAKNTQNAEKIILKNIEKCLNKTTHTEKFIDQIYALCISINTTPEFMTNVYQLIPFACTSWAFIAFALTAPKLDIQTLNYAILNEIQTIREALLNKGIDKDEYILEVVTRFQSIIIGADQFHVQVTQATLLALKEIAFLIQDILDSYDHNTNYENQSHKTQNTSDWNGAVVFDKPILRWNAILQICLNQFLTTEEKSSYEKILCESLRVAPHVEKRWVVRALVFLDSQIAIKSILYETLNHIDGDFVEFTAYELFSSKQPRARQALIRLISKNTVSDQTKIAIINYMKNFQGLEIIQELKDLLLIRLPEQVEKQIQYTLVNMSQSSNILLDDVKKSEKFTSSDIDQIIQSFIPETSLLSMDTKSALRTAEMIFIQSKDWGKEAVDLSPIVNMFSKAVELILRDTFEPFTDFIMRTGELTKKLENLGYGKLEQEKMQNFEDYIAGLPIINTIPYFSKFKLRKMLRAICLYRAGKRFTLDGPKAFALFLLVTARSTCPFLLEKCFDFYFFTDMELFEFVKQVHSLQDSRNRAVHEGLTWEAREDINSMRKQSYLIINSCLQIGIKLSQKLTNNQDTFL